jgi:hypothetical protein
MDDREVALRQAGEKWRDYESAKATLRELIPLLKKQRTMVELAELTGIPRTTLYYIVWGRSVKKPND